MMENESDLSSCIFWIFTELSTRNVELYERMIEVRNSIRRVIEYYAVRIHYNHNHNYNYNT